MQMKQHPTGQALWPIVLFLVGVCVPAAKAQEVRIKLINGKNGRIVANECLNVCVGKTVNAPSVPVDKDGVVLIHLTDDDTKVKLQQSESACGGHGVVNPVFKYADTININSNGISCDLRGSTQWRILKFQTRDVLQAGVVTGNVCGKVRVSPRPGELILFVRPETFWEQLKR
jgi:hypothetical protein